MFQRTLYPGAVTGRHAQWRKGSYANDDARELEELVDAMSASDRLRASILANATEPRQPGPFGYFKRRLMAGLGIHPRARSFHRKHARGGFVAVLREVRGLSPMPEREPDLKQLITRYQSSEEQSPS